MLLFFISMVTYGATGWYDAGSVVRLTTGTDKVGIGVTSPNSKLHVQWSAEGPTAEENRSAIYGYNISTETTYANSIGIYGRVKTNKGMAVYGYSEKSSGYAGYFRGGVGILNSGNGYYDIWRIDQDSNDDLCFRFTTNGGSSWKSILKILDNGNVGIGNTNPGYPLDVNGIVQMTGFRLPTGAANGYVLTSDSNGVGTWQPGGGGGALWSQNGNDIYYNTGKVGIGVTDPQSELTVNGVITTKEMKVKLTGWPDFVFANNHKLMFLNKLERYIKKEKSLPGIPRGKEVVEEGVYVGEMQAKLLEKVEELTLYVINQNKELTELKKEVGNLRKENRELRKKYQR